jgi:tetratricopeptide (TPR) repeat protein
VIRSSSLRHELVAGLILIGLLVLILAPRPLSGWLDLLAAQCRGLQGDLPGAAYAYAAAAERIPWQPTLWARAGEAAFSAGEIQDSIVYFQRAEGRAALSQAGWADFAKAYQINGDTADAIAAWKKALPSVSAYAYLADNYRQEGDLSAALEDWRALIALDAKNANAHYQLGLLLTATSPEQAVPELMSAAQLDPKLDASVQSLRTSLNTALLSDDRAYQLTISGIALGGLGAWDLAGEAFRRATVINPGYADAWAWLGESKQHGGQDGLMDLQKAILLDPGSAMIQDLYGIYWQRQGQTTRALAAFQRAAELEPDNAGWQMALGSAYEQSGDLVAALEHYNDAVTLSPQDASTWRALAEFSLNNDVDVAGTGLPAVQKLLALAPADWQSDDLAGLAAFEMSHLVEAEQLFLKAIQIAPDQAAPHEQLGLAYLEAGDRASAYPQLIQATTLDPNGTYGDQAQRLLEQNFP